MLVLLFWALAHLLGCQSGSYPGKRMEGKWTYTNSQEERAEFWFEKGQAMHIDETSYNIDFYKYSVSQDSLWLMDLTNKDRVTAFAITDYASGSLKLENGFVQMQLTKFSKSAQIDTTESAMSKVYSEFKERL